MDKVAEQRVNRLEHEIESLKSAVAQLSGALNLKVDKTDIINPININTGKMPKLEDIYKMEQKSERRVPNF